MFQLVTNSVAPTQVRETDSAFIVEDVPFIKPMRLSGGYVPEDSIRETMAGWAGTPVTLNHPRNDRGEPIAANRRPEIHLGAAESPRYDATAETGYVDLRIEKARLDAVGGEAAAVRRALESGEQVDVSSQYASQDLPPGEYDGRHRANAERIVRPDSIAILPNQRGRCSVADGCGINPAMVANAEVTIPMRQRANAETVAGVRFSDTAAGDLDESAINKDETDLSDHYLYGEGEDKSDYSYPVVDAQGRLRRGNVDAAHQLGCRGQCDDADAHEERLQRLAAEFDDLPAWAEDTMSGNTPTPTPNADAQFSTGDLVSWEWSGGTAQGRVADVFVDEGAITRTFDGTEVTKDSDEAPVYLVDVWRDGEYDGQALRQQDERNLSAWDDPPEKARANVDVPEEYRFDNPGEAVEAAEELGFTEGPSDERIHTHGEGDDTVFMPGPSHEALVERLREMGELDAASAHDDGMSGNAVREAFRTLREAVLGGATDDGGIPEDSSNSTPGQTATANAHADVNRAALIDDITSNSPLTRHALEARCDEGLAAIHDDVMAAAETGVSGNTDDSDAAADTTTTTMSDSDPIELDDLSENAREALVDEAVERIEANRETEQKEQLVSEIIANAADYDSDDRETLLETPLDVLRSLNTSTQAAGLPGTGATANAAPSTGTDDSVEEYPDGMIGGDL